MTDTGKINTYKIGLDTYTKLIKNISNLPDIKIDQKNLEDLININKEDEISDEEVTEILKDNRLEIPEIAGLQKVPESPVPIEQPKEQPKGGQTNKNVLNPLNYTIVQQPKLLTRKLNIPTLHNFNFKMKGGTGIKSRKQEIMKLLLNSEDNVLTDIALHYYYNIKENNNPKILNGDDIINIMVSFIYNEFTESELEFEKIIDPEYIKSIPQMYVFNFTDKVKFDVQKDVPNYETKINALNDNVDLLKKIVYNSMSKQSGGDKTIEEKINKNIENISTFLKSQKPVQKGGAVSPGQMLAEILAYQNPPNPKSKEQTRHIKDNCNIWVVELLEQKLSSKEIRDNQYNIARFYLTIPAPGQVDRRVIDFINENASILTLDDNDRIKDTITNEIRVEKLGNAKRGAYDKLQEYFNKKYQNLLELQNNNFDKSKLPIPNTEIGKIKLMLSQTGGSKLKIWEKCVLNYNINKEKGINTTYNCGPKPKDNEDLEAEDLEETCFTSKQYTIFLRKMVGYFKSINKSMNQADIGAIEIDIETLKRIEKDLLKNNTLFNNYRKIQEVHPDKLYTNITMQHLQNIEDTNSQIIDQYGKVNTNVINTIKALEKYTEAKEIEKEARNYPNLEKELDRIIQSGGGNKPYMKFNNFHDVEYFTSRRFASFVEENKGQIEEDK